MVGVGIHNNVNFQQIINEYMDPILRVIEKRPNILLVWLSTTAAGPLKPLQYLPMQGNTNIQRYNEKMSAYLKMHGVPIFDAFKMTEKAHSFDGTHYGMAMNLLKSRLLIRSVLHVVNNV